MNLKLINRLDGALIDLGCALLYYCFNWGLLTYLETSKLPSYDLHVNLKNLLYNLNNWKIEWVDLKAFKTAGGRW